MNVARQLYELQELDLEIDSDEQALERVISQLGESQAVLEARARLQAEQQRLEELVHQQHTAEWEIDDVSNKVAAGEEKLFSGRIRNPKELSDLQQDVETLKAHRNRLEEKALVIIDQVEQAEAEVAGIKSHLEALTAEWQQQQNRLAHEKKKLQDTLDGLRQRRGRLSSGIDSGAVELYEELKESKGTAVARVEQGICLGCRISLPITDLQRVRGNSLVQCSSCGRILFLA